MFFFDTLTGTLTINSDWTINNISVFNNTYNLDTLGFNTDDSTTPHTIKYISFPSKPTVTLTQKASSTNFNTTALSYTAEEDCVFIIVVTVMGVHGDGSGSRYYTWKYTINGITIDTVKSTFATNFVELDSIKYHGVLSTSIRFGSLAKDDVIQISKYGANGFTNGKYRAYIWTSE